MKAECGDKKDCEMLMVVIEAKCSLLKWMILMFALKGEYVYANHGT